MKNLLLAFVLLASTVTFAQSKNEKATLEVDGVCGMCKERIEKACITSKGVKSAIWDIETHKLALIYNAEKTDLATIKNKIASVGHDVEEVKATDEAYNSVHPCCRYRDEVVKADHHTGKTD